MWLKWNECGASRLREHRRTWICTLALSHTAYELGSSPAKPLNPKDTARHREGALSWSKTCHSIPSSLSVCCKFQGSNKILKTLIHSREKENVRAPITPLQQPAGSRQKPGAWKSIQISNVGGSDCRLELSPPLPSRCMIRNWTWSQSVKCTQVLRVRRGWANPHLNWEVKHLHNNEILTGRKSSVCVCLSITARQENAGSNSC